MRSVKSGVCVRKVDVSFLWVGRRPMTTQNDSAGVKERPSSFTRGGKVIEFQYVEHTAPTLHDGSIRV